MSLNVYWFLHFAYKCAMYRYAIKITFIIQNFKLVYCVRSDAWAAVIKTCVITAIFVTNILPRVCTFICNWLVCIMSCALWRLQLKFRMLNLFNRCYIKCGWNVCNMPIWLSSVCWSEYLHTMPVNLFFEL